jgi:hypothetical protein
VEDSREVELAVVDSSDPAHDEVAAVPERLLRRGGSIRDPGLPFDIEISGRFMKNAGLKRGRDGEWEAVERPEESGASSEGRVDEPAVSVAFRDRQHGGHLGTYLMALGLTARVGPQKVAAGGRTYEVSLRFKRTYKPYELYLYDFRFERYLGTSVPKDYSSYVKLVDPERGTERDVRVWMNNPLRYRGDTIYQASFDRESETATVLQVVTNAGWMVPYVACMIVAVGLLGQFSLHLFGFLGKRRAP